MKDSPVKTDNLEKEETESWVYTYTTEYAAEPKEGATCKIVTTTPASKYSRPISQEILNNSSPEHNVLVNGRNTLEIEPQDCSIAFRICEKGEAGHEMHLTLSLKDAYVVMRLLAQAIEEASSTSLKQAAL